MDFITEFLLDIHEKPFEKAKEKRENAAFVLLEFVNAQWYANQKYTTWKCLLDLQM